MPPQPKRDLGVARLDRPVERRADVVVVQLQAIQPAWRSAAVRCGWAASTRATKVAAWRARRSSRSPSAASCSRPYSRIVASIAKRGSSSAGWSAAHEALVGQRRQSVENVRAQLGGGSADRLGLRQVRAAGEDRRSARTCAGRARRAGRSSSRSRRAASAGASGRSRAPPVSRRRRWSSRARIAATGRSRTRAAASSMASGRPSRRRTISATIAGAFSSVSAKLG